MKKGSICILGLVVGKNGEEAEDLRFHLESLSRDGVRMILMIDPDLKLFSSAVRNSDQINHEIAVILDEKFDRAKDTLAKALLNRNPKIKVVIISKSEAISNDEKIIYTKVEDLYSKIYELIECL